MKRTASSLVIGSMLAMTPLIAAADTVHAGTSIFIGQNGIVRVVGADVTSVGNGVVNAVTTIGSTVLNWIVNVSADTKVRVGGSNTASTTSISVGDDIKFVGTITGSTGNSLTVSAKKVRDLTALPARSLTSGTISSVASTSLSFLLGSGDQTYTVRTASSTVFYSLGATSTSAILAAGQHVMVVGVRNADATIDAAKVFITSAIAQHKTSDGDGDGDDDRNERKDHDRGLKLGVWGGLHLGTNKHEK